MVIALIVLAACLLAALQIFVRRRIRQNATSFVRAGCDVSALSPLERWTLAVVAPYLMPLELPVDCFRPPESRRHATLSSLLKRDWGIQDKSQFRNVLAHLQSKGHRARCATVSGRSEEDFLAWDLLRAVLLVWSALNLEWIDYDEFVISLRSNGCTLQRAFPDWQSAAASYEAGLSIWATEGKVRRVAERGRITIQTLLDNPASPWKTTEWQTPLIATIAK